MTTISSDGTLSYSGGVFSYTGSYTGDINTWPITINAGVTVTFGSGLTLTTTSQYFTIGGSGVTIDGAGYEVDFSSIATSSAYYNGLIDGGNQTGTTVENIACINSGSSQITQYISRGNFTATSSISNCYVICSGSIINGGIAGQYNSAPISNCYVICGGGISDGGITSLYNSGTISNCYVICGGNIETGGGIAAADNSGNISNCYVICGGGITYGAFFIGGGIAGENNSGTISNCYVICGGNICGGNINGSGGIASIGNSGTISNCYVICGGSILTSSGGIAGSNNSGTISYCYVSCSNASSSNFVGNGTVTSQTNCAFDNDEKWTFTGAEYLDNSGSAWTSYETTKPWLLTAFNTAIASSTTATSTSGSISLNTYGKTFSNGSIYSGSNGASFTYVAGVAIAYSGVSTRTYTLGLYAFSLLSDLSFTFTFENDDAIQTAFNYNGTSANNIVPYVYSITDNVTLTYAAISSVCFQEKTPIQTDQGIIPIEKIDCEVNTINNKKIVAITKTISQDKYLICFEKNSLGANYPTKSTTVTKQHKILYRGKLIEAEKFVGHFAGVKKVKYNGGVLYNVLMEKHEIIRANNLQCETLHPQNIIAKLYTSCVSESYKSKLTSLINESIVKNDYTAYKKIVSRL